MDVFIQFALAAAQFAVDDARLAVTPEIADRVGVYIASGIGGFQTIEREHRRADQGRPAAHLAVLHPRVHHQPRRRPGLDPLQRARPEPRDVHRLHRLGARDRRGLRNHPPRRRRRHDRRRLRGRDHADGRRRLRRDARALDAQRRAAAAPAGRSTRTATASSWARAPASCILEELERAPARRADLRRARRLRPDLRRLPPDRPARGRARRRPLDDDGAAQGAASSRQQVDYINAHGTSTPINDPTETLGVKRLFGEHAYKLAMSSTKSMTGHLLGAAGGLEAGITALAVKHQIAPPTINLDNPDPACDLDYVPHKARPMKIRYALSNSFGFGGTNGTLLMKQFEE